MSKIEWTERTWNPTIGCTEVSPGCANCYAARIAYRLGYNPLQAANYEGLAKKLSNSKIVWTGEIRFIDDRLLEPVRRAKPTTYFVDSMSDLFHPGIPFDVIAQVFAVMALCPQHTFQVLTKRPDRALAFFNWTGDMRRVDEAAEIIVCDYPDLFHEKDDAPGAPDGFVISNRLFQRLKEAGWAWDTTYTQHGKDTRFICEQELPHPNIWIGVSVEDQRRADERIPYLINIPAAVRFLSCEPLLGLLDLHQWNWRPENPYALDWIIAGGESGPGARPMHPDWVASLRDQCQMADIPFFFKQWGEWRPYDHAAGDNQKPLGMFQNAVFRQGNIVWDNKPGSVHMAKVGKKAAGALLAGEEFKQYPKKVPHGDN
jgi:protein gp37